MILRNFISLRAFTVYMENSLRFEICTEVSFTTPEVMWTLIMKLPHTKVKFYPEVKSQTVLSSIRASCKRALIMYYSVLGEKNQTSSLPYDFCRCAVDCVFKSVIYFKVTNINKLMLFIFFWKVMSWILLFNLLF